VGEPVNIHSVWAQYATTSATERFARTAGLGYGGLADAAELGKPPCIRSLLERIMEAGIGPAAGLSHDIVEHEGTVTPSGAAKAGASFLASWENCGVMPSHLTSLIRNHLFTLPSSPGSRSLPHARTTLGHEMYQPDC
jgi:hypothetical protein